MLDVNYIISNTFYIILLLTAAPLLTSLIVGLLVSVFQAVTQIQDASLAFIPKVVLVFLVILLSLNWGVELLTNFSLDLFNNISEYGKQHV